MIHVKAKLDGEFFKHPLFVMDDEMNRAMAKSVILAEEAVALGTPVGVNGHLRIGIRGNMIPVVRWGMSGEKGFIIAAPAVYRGYVGVVGPAVKYAEPVEVGRKAGKMPPDAPIRRWLEITDKGKAFVADIKEKYNIKKRSTALNSATFLKRRAIGRQGTRGAFMFQEGEQKVRSRVIAYFEAAKRAIEKRLSDK